MFRDSRFIGRVELLIEHITTMMLDKKRGNKAKLGIMQADGMPIIAHQQGCLSVLIFVYLKVFSCCKTHWGLQVLKLLPLSRVDFPCWTNLKSSYDAVDPRGRIPMVETVPYRKLFQKRCPASFCWAQTYRQIPPNFRCCIWTFISFLFFWDYLQ